MEHIYSPIESRMRSGLKALSEGSNRWVIADLYASLPTEDACEVNIINTVNENKEVKSFARELLPGV